MTSAGIYRGSCLRWVVRYLPQCYCMGLDISSRPPRTQLRPSLIRLGSAECPATVGPELLQVEGLARRFVEGGRFPSLTGPEALKIQIRLWLWAP